MLDFTLHGWDVVDALGLTPAAPGRPLDGRHDRRRDGRLAPARSRPARARRRGRPLDRRAPDPRHLRPAARASSPSCSSTIRRAARRCSPAAPTSPTWRRSRSSTSASSGASRMAGKILFPIPNRRLSKRLYRLTAPTLVLWGAADRLIAAGLCPALGRADPRRDRRDRSRSRATCCRTSSPRPSRSPSPLPRLRSAPCRTSTVRTAASTTRCRARAPRSSSRTGSGGNHLSWWQQVPALPRALHLRDLRPSRLRAVRDGAGRRGSAGHSSTISPPWSIISAFPTSGWWPSPWAAGPASAMRSASRPASARSCSPARSARCPIRTSIACSPPRRGAAPRPTWWRAGSRPPPATPWPASSPRWSTSTRPSGGCAAGLDMEATRKRLGRCATRRRRRSPRSPCRCSASPVRKTS